VSEELKITSIERQDDGTYTIEGKGRESKKKYRLTGCYPIAERTGLETSSKTVTLTYNYDKAKAK
jgi:hypothetical protein